MAFLAGSISGATLGALIGAGAAVLASVLSLLSSRSASKAVQRQRTTEYALRQLNELYGPLYMRRRLSLQLWKQLPGVPDAVPGVTKWKLIDHIEEIKANPSDKRYQLVENILEINRELSSLIVGEAGLLNEFPPPPSFTTFLEHANMLQVLWDKGINADQSGVDYVPFPGDFDPDVKASIDAVRKKLS